jgi:hypothetical protein
MRGHEAHVWMCGAMVLGALALVLFTGNAFALPPVIGSVLMIVVMTQMLGGMGGDDRGSDGK